MPDTISIEQALVRYAGKPAHPHDMAELDRINDLVTSNHIGRSVLVEVRKAEYVVVNRRVLAIILKFGHDYDICVDPDKEFSQTCVHLCITRRSN